MSYRFDVIKMKYCSIGLSISKNAISATVLDEQMKIITELKKSSSFPISPENVLSNVIQILKDQISKLRNYKISAIGISCYPSSLILHSKDKILGEPIITRGFQDYDLIEELMRMDLEFWLDHVGNIPSPKLNVARILHVKEHRKITYQNTKYLLDLISYIVKSLTGKVVIDKTTAFEWGLLNKKTLTWDDLLINMLEIDTEKLPDLVEPATTVGNLSSEIKETLGLNYDIPIVIGSTDAAATCLGACLLNNSDTFISYMAPSYAGVVSDLPHGSFHYHLSLHAYPNLYIMGSELPPLEEYLSWLQKTYNVNYNEEIEKKRIFQEKVVKMIGFPFIVDEYSECYPKLKGMIGGFDASSTNIDLFAGSLLGYAFAINLVFKSLEESRISLSEKVYGLNVEGVTHFSELVTDVLCKNQEIFHGQLSSLGAALMAKIGINEITWNDIKRVRESLSPSEATPSEKCKIYRRIFKQYFRMLKFMKTVFDEIDKLDYK